MATHSRNESREPVGWDFDRLGVTTHAQGVRRAQDRSARLSRLGVQQFELWHALGEYSDRDG